MQQLPLRPRLVDLPRGTHFRLGCTHATVLGPGDDPHGILIKLDNSVRTEWHGKVRVQPDGDDPNPTLCPTCRFGLVEHVSHAFSRCSFCGEGTFHDHPRPQAPSA